MAPSSRVGQMCSVAWCHTAHLCDTAHCTVQCMVQCSALYSAVYRTLSVLYSSVQYSTVQYNAAQRGRVKYIAGRMFHCLHCFSHEGRWEEGRAALCMALQPSLHCNVVNCVQYSTVQ